MYVPTVLPFRPASPARGAVKSDTWSAGCAVRHSEHMAEMPRDIRLSAARSALTDGTREAGHILRRGDARVIGGAIGYWAFDNAVLWATFHAFGASPPLTVILMGYLIGQLGGLLPIPGGVGVAEAAMSSSLVVLGIDAEAALATTLAYRICSYYFPPVPGWFALKGLRRDHFI